MHAQCTECGDGLTCGISVVMKDVRDAIAKILEGTTLVDVLEQIDNAEGAQRGVLNFCI